MRGVGRKLALAYRVLHEQNSRGVAGVSPNFCRKAEKIGKNPAFLPPQKGVWVKSRRLSLGETRAIEPQGEGFPLPEAF